MSVKIIYPPRPKSKMLPTDLSYYENTGEWLAQRKFRGSRAVINISVNSEVTLGNRHGKSFARFNLSKSHKEQILSLNLKPKTEYWLDGELMNKDVDATNEIILFDVLQIGRYFFGSPSQLERIQLLNEICGNPSKKCRSNIALEITSKVWLAETFSSNFKERFEETLPNPQLEGLVLRKKLSTLDNFGVSEYETPNLIRCRKNFAKDKGYNF